MMNLSYGGTTGLTPIPVPYVLLVEANEGIASLLHCLLHEELNWQTVQTSTARAAIQTMREIKPTLLVMNQYLPDDDGIAFYDYLHTIPSFRDIPVILLTTNIEECLDHLGEREIYCLGIPCDLTKMIETFQIFLTSSEKET